MTIQSISRAADLEARFRARTPRSAAMFERAGGALPGGSTRTTVFFEPYPPYIDRGIGATLVDIDGNDYVDFLNNYSSLILGHAHPAVVEAVERQVAKGSAFGAPTPVEVELAEEIGARLPSIERLRFTNSGTEATMMALRLARAATGREVIAKFTGSYHGTHDFVLSGTRGVPSAVGDLVVELPYEDAEAVRERLSGREASVAAIIIEPVLGSGGARSISTPFLSFLRSFTEQHGIVLIFDEIVAFRIGYHGAQGAFGVTPDLTTLGKIIGGGYPLAAFGGRADLMAELDARQPGSLVHGGTFNGNPVAAAAGLATLREMTPEQFDAINDRGDSLRIELAARLAASGLDLGITGTGSLFNLNAGLATATSPESRATFQRLLHLALVTEGYYLAPRGLGALSVPIAQQELDGFVDATLRAGAAVFG